MNGWLHVFVLVHLWCESEFSKLKRSNCILWRCQPLKQIDQMIWFVLAGPGWAFTIRMCVWRVRDARCIAEAPYTFGSMVFVGDDGTFFLFVMGFSVILDRDQKGEHWSAGARTHTRERKADRAIATAKVNNESDLDRNSWNLCVCLKFISRMILIEAYASARILNYKIHDYGHSGWSVCWRSSHFGFNYSIYIHNSIIKFYVTKNAIGLNFNGLLGRH